MKIKISDIPEDGLDFKGFAEPDGFLLPSEGVHRWLGISYDLHLEKLDDELLVRGKIDASLQIICARCTDPIDWNIQVPKFCQSFKIQNDDLIDLTEQVAEDIVLSFPIAPSCKLDDQKKCPLSGESFDDSRDSFIEENRQNVWGVLDQLNLKENHGKPKT